MAPVIGQETFRTWIAEASLETLPTDPAERLAQLTGVYEKIVEAFKQAESRIPHLKIFRVLAALFPYDITTIADRGALEKLLRALGRSRGPNPVERHVYVRTRIEEALGPSSGSVEELAFRMQLPWFLYDLQDREEPEEDRVSKPGQKPGEEILLPLPAARRRRGLTPIAGNFQSVLSILEFLKDGVTRQELMDYLRGIFPNLKDNSLGVNINVLKSELGVTRIVNNEYVLTDRGLRVLESSDASGLADWLLTRVLGIDNLLKALSTGPKSKIEMMALLMGVNPGWTSEYVPAAMIGWLISMAALRREPNGMLALDIIGEEWAARINWEPETLKPDPWGHALEDAGMRQEAIRPQFVECIPDHLDEGVLYISERYRTATHKCCCGCGQEVVTPLTPADWLLRKDGPTVTLRPSIGNWGFPCRSHYLIQRNRVVWAEAMSNRQIAQVRRQDLAAKAAYAAAVNRKKDLSQGQDAIPAAGELRGPGSMITALWKAMQRLFRGA